MLNKILENKILPRPLFIKISYFIKKKILIFFLKLKIKNKN